MSPHDRRLLVPYAAAGCGEDEALDFEVHLLGCDSCLEDLKVLDRAGVLIQEHLAGRPPEGRGLAHLLTVKSDPTSKRSSARGSKAGGRLQKP